MPNHSLCGVLKPDGRDCEIPVAPGAPFNVCPTHLQAVAEYARAVKALAVHKVRLRVPCPECGVKALVAVVGEFTATCQSCGHEAAGDDPAKAAAHRRQQPEPTSVVYYIRFGDRIKIGTTVDLRSRLIALPYDELLLTEPGSYELEKQRHRQFNRHLIAGREWFHAAPELLQFIAERRTALAS